MIGNNTKRGFSALLDSRSLRSMEVRTSTYAGKGYTLVEVLIASAIIGIIASIVVVSMTSARLKARDAKRISDIQQVRIALEQYFAANKRYPNSSSSGYCELVTQLQSYLQILPRDPLDVSASCTAAAGYAYFTELGLQPKEWLLRVATLENPSGVRDALNEDLDGTAIAP